MEDFGFYLVMTNPKVGYERCCEAAVKAGVKMVQLRMKDVSRGDLLQMAKRLVGITRGSETNLAREISWHPHCRAFDPQSRAGA